MFYQDIVNSGDAVPIIAITLGFLLGLVWTIGVLCIGFVKALKGRGNKRGGQLDVEETRAFQELERGFRRMEDRVEALETLIIDKRRAEKAPRPFD